MRRAPANLCACGVAAAAILAFAGCGADERRDVDAPDGTYTVDVERASFPLEQRLAQHNALVITVRNAGDRAIPNLVVTVRGFTDRSGGARNSDAGRDLWIVDEAPRAAATALQDTWAAGRLEPDRSATLRWRLTPVVAGAHELTYAIAPAIAGGGRAELAEGGPPEGSLRVRVSGEPAAARADPRTGRVRREE